MKRLTFSHEDLYDFPESEVGGYVKLIFPDKNDLSKSFSRPFTVRNFRRNSLEIDIDFVIHDGDHGYASSWINSVNNGDEIFITGPGPRRKFLIKLIGSFLLVTCQQFLLFLLI